MFPTSIGANEEAPQSSSLTVVEPEYRDTIPRRSAELVRWYRLDVVKATINGLGKDCY